MARRPLARLRRGDHASGRSARWSAAGRACSRPTTRPTTRGKIAATVAECVPDEAERRWIEPALLALLGVERPRQRRPRRAVRGLADVLRAARRERRPSSSSSRTSTGPTPGLLDFIDHLLEWSRGFPILSSRWPGPELLERRPDWGAGRRNFIALVPRAADRTRRCASCSPASCRACRERGAAAIVARADGIPLYAVETVRMLVAEGRLARDGRHAIGPVGDLGELAVPETLHGAHRRPPRRASTRPTGALLQDAAVLGQSFTLGRPRGGHRASTRAELEPRLRALVRRELLALETDPRSPERGQYAFVQALIREVAYNTLAEEGPQDAATSPPPGYFESLGDDELAGALAGHYLAAMRTPSTRPRGRRARRPGADRPRGRPPSGRRRWARTTRPSRSWTRP